MNENRNAAGESADVDFWGHEFRELKEYLKQQHGYEESHFRWFNYGAEGDNPETNTTLQNGSYDARDTRQPIVDSALRLNGQIRRWAQACPNSQIDIIAHSLGGAVVAYWAGSQPDGSATVDRVHAVLTIESPLGGIPIANCVIASISTLLDSITGEVGGDLCIVKDTMKAGLERVPTLAVNNRADVVVNGCIAQGMTRADGQIDGTLAGRLWDSYEFGTSLVPTIGPFSGIVSWQLCSRHYGRDMIAAITGNQVEHGLPLTASCGCWGLVDKLVSADFYDDQGPGIALSGSWERQAHHNRVMATSTVSSQRDATFTLDVLGPATKIVWIATKGPSAGDAKVSICGGPEQNISLRQARFDSRAEFEFAIPSDCSEEKIRIRVPGIGILDFANDVSVDGFEVY